MIASTACRNSKEKLHLHLGIPTAIQVGGVRQQERGGTRNHLRAPFSQPRGQLETPSLPHPRATLSAEKLTSELLQKWGLPVLPWLPSPT